MTKKTKDIGASVKAQLLRIARERGDDYQLLSLRHANERLLYRLAISPCASHFVLKGAALFTLVQLGMANSRMKDFFDIVVLANAFEFQGQPLLDAIRATFKRRGTAIPKERPVAFSSAFSGDASKKTQWAAFVKKSGIEATADLGNTVAAVAAFLEEPLTAAITSEPFTKHWSGTKGWN